MIIADRLDIPDRTEAVLWDMDGVLLDSLGLDLVLCTELLRKHLGPRIEVSRDFIRSIFAYHPPEFWRLILARVEKEFHCSASPEIFEQILTAYNTARNEAVFEVNPGIREILAGIKASKLKTAVVSNNPTSDVEKILSQAGIICYFDAVVGNDIRNLAKKPAPDTYLFGAERLQVQAGACVVVEDSILGAEAGKRAGCFTVGVATGGDTFATLEQSAYVNRVYSSFLPQRLTLNFGMVTKKTITTPNEFVSHMIEHIAWRLGCSIELHWNHNDWFALGLAVGKRISDFPVLQRETVALGMIDDGSAEVVLAQSDDPGLRLNSIESLDLEWFLGLRCEQLDSGRPLLQLLQGLARGLSARIEIRVCAVEDPHHSWEGVFRGLGIALHKMYAPAVAARTFSGLLPLEKNISGGDISLNSLSANFAEVSRKTAESSLIVTVDFSREKPNMFRFETAARLNPESLAQLLTELATAAGFTMQITFKTTALSSSHVVLEDTALVLGRALKEILIRRMQAWGVNGAGSSLVTPADLEEQAIRVGISVEGRKFLKFLPFTDSYERLRREFLIGQNVGNGLLSEDLDDFLDGLAGGLGASIIIHVKTLVEADRGWRQLFTGLGRGLGELFQENPNRKGVPPGVKATLA